MSDKPAVPEETFSEIAHLIETRRARVERVINTELIDLYWEIGKVLSHQINQEKWGRKVIE